MSNDLTTALKELEAAAAVVGHLLQDADDALLAEVAGAWGPLMPKGYQARRWHPFWIAWLQDCADRLPPADQASARELEELIVRWAKR
jgi:hypothetical protein